MPRKEPEPKRMPAPGLRRRTPADMGVSVFTTLTLAAGSASCVPPRETTQPAPTRPEIVNCLDDTRVVQYNRFPVRGISPNETHFTPHGLLEDILGQTHLLYKEVNRDTERKARLFSLFDAMLAQVNRELLPEGGEPTLRQDHLNLLTMAFIDPAIEEKYPELAYLTKPFRMPTPETTEEQKQAAAGGVLDFLDRVGIISNDALTDPNDPNMCIVSDGIIRVVSGPYKGMAYPDILHGLT